VQTYLRTSANFFVIILEGATLAALSSSLFGVKFNTVALFPTLLKFGYYSLRFPALRSVLHCLSVHHCCFLRKKSMVKSESLRTHRSHLLVSLFQTIERGRYLAVATEECPSVIHRNDLCQLGLLAEECMAFELSYMRVESSQRP